MKENRFAWATIGLAILLAGPARAELVNDFAPFVYDTDTPEVLLLKGPIDGRTPLLLTRALRRFPEITTLALFSEGGSIYAALPMAYEVRDARLKTTIPSGGACASACSYLFFAGVERSAQGPLGVHRIATGNNNLDTGQVALGDIFSSFEDFGVPTTVIARMMNAPAEEMYWFEPAEMAALGLIGEEAAPVATIPSAIDRTPNMMAADMRLEFPGDDAVNFATEFRAAAWALESSPDCDGEVQQLSDGGTLCSMVVSGTLAELAQAGTGMDTAGLSFVELSTGVYEMTWDLDRLFSEELGSLEDMPPRNVFEALMGDDTWTFHIVADRILDTNGTRSADGRIASFPVLMTDVFARSAEAPKVFTAIVRVARDPSAPLPPRVAVPAAPPPAATPGVLTVKPAGGDYREIRDAVAAAAEGARIEVYPGTYQLGVDIAKPVEIVGVGPREAILWRVANDDVVAWTAPSGRIAGLTLRQTGIGENDAWSAVELGGGSVILENNDLTAEDAAVVMVFGSATAPTVTGNAIHGGGQSGVFFYDGATGTVDGNDIFANTYGGVNISTGANPVVRGNRIHENGEGGVFVWDEGLGQIENNEIYANTLAGIEIKTGADPLVRNNIIRDGREGGILLHVSGRGTIEENDIYGNTYAGIVIREQADPVVRNNRIHDGKESGLFLLSGARGTIEGNEIFANALPGISIRDGADPVVRGNRIHANAQAGVFIYENGLGRIEDNEIYANLLAGVELSTGADPAVRGNVIRDGEQGGILVQNDARGTFEGNRIYGNRYSGMVIRERANPMVRDNDIYGGQEGGIYVLSGGAGEIADNRIYDNALDGIAVESAGAPVVRGNAITGNRYAIRLFNGGMGDYVGNDLRGNREGAISAEGAGSYTERDNLLGDDPAPAGGDGGGASILPGLTVDLVTDARRQEFGLAQDAQGLVIVAVDQNSRAWRDGFRAGLVIEEAAQRRLTTASDLEAAVDEAQAGGKTSLLLLLSQDGDPLFKAFRLK